MRKQENQILLLYALSFVKRIKGYELTPFVFLMQLEGRERKQKTVNYPFTFAWKRPLSEEVQIDLRQLEEKGWIRIRRDVEVTEKGEEALQPFMHFIREVAFETFMVWFVSQYPSNEYERYCSDLHIQKGNLLEYANLIPHFSNRKLGKSGAVTSRVIREMIEQRKKECARNLSQY